MRAAMTLSVVVLAALGVGVPVAWGQTGAGIRDGFTTICPPMAKAATSVAASTSASLHDTECGPARELLATHEDCTITIIPRAARPEQLRALVPERYGLMLLASGNAQFFIVDEYCADVTVHGNHSVPTTTTYIGAPITSVDGQPLSSIYFLYIGTNNPELFAFYRSAGFPVDFLRTTSTTITNDGTTTQVVYNIEGGEFAHTLTVLPLLPVPPFFFDTGGTWLYDGPHGLLSFTEVTDFGPVAPAIVGGSIMPETTLADLLATPLTFANVRFPRAYRTGDFAVTVAVTCPTE